MSGHRELVADAQDLIRTCRVFAEVPDVDLAQVADYRTRLDQFSLELAAKGRLYEQSAAWCRLASGLLRGEDVPESIHAPDGGPGRHGPLAAMESVLIGQTTALDGTRRARFTIVRL